MKTKLILSLFAVAMAAGCASKPSDIAPSYVSPVMYEKWSCPQLIEEFTRVNHALATASKAQNQARSNDIAGVILIGLPVSSLSGSNQAANIGRLKGEKEAVERSIIKNNCGSIRRGGN